MNLEGRVAVVTGGASGIGAATVRLLKGAGARPVSWDLNAEADIMCDIADHKSVQAALDATIARYGVPSILVHAAAITSRADILDLDLESWDRAMAVNARGAYICLSLVAKAMVEGDVDAGSIVLLSSTSSTLTDRAGAAYGGSKAVVNHLARIAALELGQYGIRVNAVLPGPTETPLTKRTLSSEEYRKAVVDTTPLGQIGTPELLADAVVNTLQMDWVTGQLITADGGTHLVTPRGALRAKLTGNFKAGETTEAFKQAAN